MIPADMRARLLAALPAGVPVLLPEELETPLAGRHPGQPGGITAYLLAHPGGYVQIEQPLPITADDYLATYWTAVACVAPTATGAAGLAEEVRRALCGFPDEPGPHRRVIPDTPRPLAEGAYLVRPSYETIEIDGEFAV